MDLILPGITMAMTLEMYPGVIIMMLDGLSLHSLNYKNMELIQLGHGFIVKVNLILYLMLMDIANH